MAVGVSAAPRGTQFVSGPCKKDADCQQGCCGFNTGKCAGPSIAQTRDGGCGFGNAKPNCNVAAALKLNACAPGAVKTHADSPAVQAAAKVVAKLDNLPFTPAKKPADTKKARNGKRAAAKNAGKKAKPTVAQLAAQQKSKKAVGTTCKADKECQQGCCGFKTGTCAGPAVAQTNGAGGCGHGSKTPNCNVATALGLQANCAAGAKANKVKGKEVQQAAAFAAQLDSLPFTPA